MFDNQTKKFCSAVVDALPNDISEDVMQGWIQNPKGLQRFLQGLCPPKVAPTPQPLLIPLGTAIVAPTTTPFVARDHFLVKTEKNAVVRISYLGDNFKRWFLGKTEVPFAGSTLRYAKLSRSSLDGPVIAELGGEKVAETTLTELFSLLEKQPNDERGHLLTNGYANIFYIKDLNDVLRAVHARWAGGGWDLDANPVTYPSEWRHESQVFSRDSR